MTGYIQENPILVTRALFDVRKNVHDLVLKRYEHVLTSEGDLFDRVAHFRELQKLIERDDVFTEELNIRDEWANLQFGLEGGKSLQDEHVLFVASLHLYHSSWFYNTGQYLRCLSSLLSGIKFAAALEFFNTDFPIDDFAFVKRYRLRRARKNGDKAHSSTNRLRSQINDFVRQRSSWRSKRDAARAARKEFGLSDKKNPSLKTIERWLRDLAGEGHWPNRRSSKSSKPHVVNPFDALSNCWHRLSKSDGST